MQQSIAAYGLIKNKNGETLFIKRAQTDTHPGIWELPGGGVNFGEDPATTAKREVMEETGIDIEIIKPVKIFTTISDDNQKQTIRIVYGCAAPEVDKVNLTNEHSAYRWILKEDVTSFYED
jgi:8-oxo-dGTP diphosphatase